MCWWRDSHYLPKYCNSGSQFVNRPLVVTWIVGTVSHWDEGTVIPERMKNNMERWPLNGQLKRHLCICETDGNKDSWAKSTHLVSAITWLSALVKCCRLNFYDLIWNTIPCRVMLAFIVISKSVICIWWKTWEAENTAEGHCTIIIFSLFQIRLVSTSETL